MSELEPVAIRTVLNHEAERFIVLLNVRVIVIVLYIVNIVWLFGLVPCKGGESFT
ncbi:hypothetical protein FB556_2164 [Enteractinococcus coprophilus]|uniref:Uncharacterized protein n=1 Tax=Enteractinococcus coprophilus TaxID=1027633 RepID=A0A543AGF7_9MICC|nr:hypothetical protein FB556_2164 [Enteractinococcus coprophilus]